jgi:hypothetical protein
MVFEEAVRVIRAHVEGKFPKTCTLCERVFFTLFDYVRGTRPVGEPVSYDAVLEDWTPTEPIGTYTLVLCSCGTSLAIDSSGMNLLMLWRLMRFARKETRRTGETVSALLERIRKEVHRQVIIEGDEKPSTISQEIARGGAHVDVPAVYEPPADETRES